MSDQLFDVVFFGILQTGKDKESVMQNMAQLFKTEAGKLAPYFAGGRKVIKGKVNAATAEKYKAALENVGLVVNIEPCESGQQEQPDGSENTAPQSQKQSADIDTADLSVAPVGADVIEHPEEKPVQEIDDISNISMAEAGVDVIENPVKVKPQKIADISDISMAEPGADVLLHHEQVTPQKIDDISDLTLAEAGADIIENPKPKVKAKIPDTSELSLDD